MIKSTNIMTIEGHPASVAYEDEIKAFRGKFLDVNGYCDFVSDSIEGLKKKAQCLWRNSYNLVLKKALSLLKRLIN